MLALFCLTQFDVNSSTGLEPTRLGTRNGAWVTSVTPYRAMRYGYFFPVVLSATPSKVVITSEGEPREGAAATRIACIPMGDCR